MTYCIVYDETTKESQACYGLAAAKRWMRERLKQGHKVSGQKYRIPTNGDTVNCGPINIDGDNKSFVANSKQTQKGY